MTKVPAVGFVSLGCPKALVDSERILTQLRAEGYAIAPQYRDADLVVVNTCGFIDEAVHESLDAIGEALRENSRVIVTGCLGAKGSIVRDTHPSVLAVTGPHALDEVMQAVHAHLPRPNDPFSDLVPHAGIANRTKTRAARQGDRDCGVKLTPRHYAYLKISEGCNHRCSFCIIPSMRGDLVSRPIGEVIREAEQLVNAGVKELLVISQDTSAYGVDLKYRVDLLGSRAVRTRMTELCRELGELGVWVRLHYVYPYPHVDEVIPLMADGKILPYLDVPFQHASPRILKAMKRPANTENTLARIRAWRAICPDIAIRSTFIVGFPGETEADFCELLDFLDAAHLDRVGCFSYSPVEGAAANALANPVPEAIKIERHARFMQKQAAISAGRLATRIGRTLDVLVDAHHPDGSAVGRSYADAPEIDGLVLIADGTRLKVGELAHVTVTAATEHDLHARLSDCDLPA